MRIKVVQSTIGLFAAIPAAFIHPFNLFVPPSRALMLLRTGNGNERVHLNFEEKEMVSHVDVFQIARIKDLKVVRLEEYPRLDPPSEGHLLRPPLFLLSCP
jgi:hypothetical protein